MEGGAWWAAVHGVAESDMTATSHSLFTFMEKEMATHSSVLAWRPPGTGEPGGVAQSWTRLRRLSSSSSIVNYSHHAVAYSPRAYFITESLYLLTPFIHFVPPAPFTVSQHSS